MESRKHKEPQSLCNEINDEINVQVPQFSVLTKKSVQSIINEQKLLSKLNSPFIVNMHYAFQDRETLYLVLDIMEGGDLRHHLSVKTFSELQSSKSILKQSFLLLALFWGWNIFITTKSYTEISNHKILYLTVKVTLG